MPSDNEEVRVEGVYGGVKTENNNLPVERTFWSNMKAFWLQEIDLRKIDWKREIKVELTPYQQKIEDEINEFLHQDITWEKFRNFVMKPFTSKKDN